MTMPITKHGIPPEDFYSGRNSRQDLIEAIINKQGSSEISQTPKFMTQLLGPSQTWKIFKKQQDAIDCCFCRRNGLMPFAYEDINGRRMFLAAHPKVFWVINSERFFKNCCTYEIIREYSACKLYLDLEYEYEYNCDKDGIRMLNNILKIININLRDVFKINCTNKDILDLDSSSDKKFSHHVIYEIMNVAFQNNYAVGSFIKKICEEIKEAYVNRLDDNSKLQKIIGKYDLQQNDILELFVLDRKGLTQLFLDEAVYTKNRHFRLLGSSKFAKRVPLKVSENNKYIVSGEYKELEYFLDSLITYFSWEVERVLEFEEDGIPKYRKGQPNLRVHSEGVESHIHPQIDNFIQKIVSPKGWIRKKVCFNDSSTIVYDILGYRYCHNIQREHKNNNIKYVVDLKSLKYYQKCYDPDCADFRSESKPLPEEICFLFEDDSLFVNVDSIDFEESSEEEFVKAVEKIEGETKFEETVSDEVLEEIAEFTEVMLNSLW